MKILAYSIAAVVLAGSLSSARADHYPAGDVVRPGAQAVVSTVVKEGRQAAPVAPAPLTDVDRYLNDRGGDPAK